jgi:D-3-phosphoglycerate dehydrogenase
VDADIIRAGKKLRLIGRGGVGIDNIDSICAKEHNISVINTPTANSISTAEFTFALMLSLARSIPHAHEHVQKGQWLRSNFTGSELAYKNLGIIGFGNIGRLLAVRAQAFAMHVCAYDPLVDASLMAEHRVQKLELPELLAKSDIISLHCGLNNHTRGLINDKTIELMKSGLMLINAARGELIDDEALIRALNKGRISKAALDVYHKEPPINNGLIGHPKIITTPHLGASTQEAQQRVAILLAEQTIKFFIS